MKIMRHGIRLPSALVVLLITITTGNAVTAANTICDPDVSKVSIPAEPAKGMVHGINFNIQKASLQNGVLTLRQGKDFFADQEFMIFTFQKQGETLSGKKFMVKPDDGFGVPHIHLGYKVADKNLPKTEMFMNKYAMKLEFNQQSDKKLRGKVYLCLPDEMHSFVSGVFEAELE